MATFVTRRPLRAAGLALFFAAEPLAAPAGAQSVPTVDTEDSELGDAAVGGGRLHPTVAADVRNGDFVRGGYDDDGADLGRVPVHLQIGLGFELSRDRRNRPDLWLVARSSNGFHAPRPGETSPRSWYESNNNLALVAALADGLRGGLAYAVKTSPNGISDTTNEVSATFAYRQDSGVGALNPTFVATVRSKGDDGLDTQAGIEPSFDLGEGEDAPAISIPAHLGVGWDGFYGPATGRVTWGNVGLAYSHPVRMGDTRWSLRAEALALFRDDTLRRLGRASSREAETSAVVPFVTLAMSLAY